MHLDELIAICGPSCTLCPAFQATHSGEPSALERLAAEWTKIMGRAFAANDVICDGCRVQGKRLSTYCSTCEIRLCSLGKGHPTCVHCSECPCDKIVAPPAQKALAELKKNIAGL